MKCLTSLIAAAVLCTGLAGRADAAAVSGPVEAAIGASYAAVHVGGEGLPRTIGSAVAYDERHVLTNAHVLKAGNVAVQTAVLVRHDGAKATARVLARSDRMDLAILVAPVGFLRPAAKATGGVAEGMAVWAAGSSAAGPVRASGWISRLALHVPAFGPGMIARMDAAQGFSGGPVLDQAGRVVGITTALRDAGPAGLAEGAPAQTHRPRREVFLLTMAAVDAEARALIAARR